MSTQNKEHKKPYITKFLQSPPGILKGFHHDDVQDFLSVGIEEKYQQGDAIVEKSDYVNSAYLICKGKLAVWEDNIELATLHENSFFGETFLFGDSNRMARIVALEDAIVLRFQRRDMLFFFKKKPAKLFNIFTRNIIYIQQKKMKMANEIHLELKKRLLKLENKS